MKEEIIINTQLALFFESPIQRPDQLVTSFNEAVGEIFDQVPVILPVPNQVQLLEVPLVQINSGNGVYSCNIARNRVDFFIAGEGKQKFADIKTNLLDKVVKYYNFFTSKSKIKRIGFVVRFFVQDEKPDLVVANLISDDFKKIQDGETNQTYVRFTTRTKIGDYEINNYSSAERTAVNIEKVGEKILGVMITRDFNTIPENNYTEKFSVKEMEQFIREAESKFNLEEIKKLLWP